MKVNYIFMVFDTLTEYHIDKALESFNAQDKEKINTFILYNNSTSFNTSDLLKKIDFHKVECIDSNLPSDKKIVSDINYQLREITGADIYFLHKADFYIPSNLLANSIKTLSNSNPSFLNFGKFDMREDIRGAKIDELNLLNTNSFKEVCKLDEVINTARGLTLKHRLIGYQGHDGSMHAYNEEGRKALTFKNFIHPSDWQVNVNKGINMIKGADNAYAYHMWHDIGQRSDGGKLGKNVIGHRF